MILSFAFLQLFLQQQQHPVIAGITFTLNPCRLSRNSRHSSSFIIIIIINIIIIIIIIIISLISFF